MALQQNPTQEERVQPITSEIQFKVRRVRPMRIESFRRKSLEDVLDSTQKAMRKDSVVPLSMCRDASGLSVPGAGNNRKLSRKMSLRPPTTVFNERSEKQDSVPDMTSDFKTRLEISLHENQLLGHHVTCECGRSVFLPCLAASLGRENGEVCIEIQRRSLDEISLKNVYRFCAEGKASGMTMWTICYWASAIRMPELVEINLQVSDDDDSLADRN